MTGEVYTTKQLKRLHRRMLKSPDKFIGDKEVEVLRLGETKVNGVKAAAAKILPDTSAASQGTGTVSYNQLQLHNTH